MRISLARLENAVPALKQIVSCDKLKAKISFRLSYMIDSVEPALKNYGEKKLNLYKKYGEEQDGNITIKPEVIDTFQKELSDLMNEEANIFLPGISPEDIEEVEISAEKIGTIKDWLFGAERKD